MAEKSVNLSKNDHKQFNTFPKLLDPKANIRLVRFWDVGTGNCNTLYDLAGNAVVYFDFGGNMGTGAKTYPYKGKPNDNNDNRPLAAFPLTGSTRFVISHWDNDHVYSLKAQPGAGSKAWLGPREDIAPQTQKLVVKEVGKSLRIWRDSGEGKEIKYATDAGTSITLVRCNGNPLQGAGKSKERNDTGITMVVEIKTPTLASQAVKKIEEQAKLAANNAAAAANADNAQTQNDPYRESVIAAARAKALQLPNNADAVVFAAKEAAKGATVKATAAALFAAMDAVIGLKAANVTLALATIAACKHAEPGLELILLAVDQQVTGGKDARTAARAGATQVTLGAAGAAIATALAALDQAVANGGDAKAVVDKAKLAAPLFANDPWVKPIVAAAAQAANMDSKNAPAAATAAVRAIPEQTPELACAKAALVASFEIHATAMTVLVAAMRAAITALAVCHPLAGRVLSAALGEVGKLNPTAQTVFDAAVAALAQAPAAPDLQALIKMRVESLKNTATNATTLKAAGEPTATGYHANRLIRAARKKVAELDKKKDAAAVVQAALTELITPPADWVTRILLTGDACYQAVPKTTLKEETLPKGTFKDREWDVLLAYHHGSRLGFCSGESPARNHFAAPVPALPGHSVVVYSAGRRPTGTYVHKHPEQVAVDKYRAAGWVKSRELHTHPWPASAAANTRGNRDYNLPYCP